MIRELTLREKLDLWADHARWAVDATHADTRCEVLDEYRVDAGLNLQDAVELIAEQEAEIAGLVLERDEANRQLSELILVTADAIRKIEATFDEPDVTT